MNAPTAHPAIGAAVQAAATAADRAARQQQVVAALRPVLPAHALLHHREDTVPYECDGLTAYRALPLAVALPETEAQIAAVLKACHALAVPVVARGAGTGLSGGAMPHTDRRGAVAGQVQPHRQARPVQPHGGGAVRRAQPGHQRGGGAARPVLRARPQQPDRLHHRRQRGRELRRRALPEIRPDPAQPAEGARLHRRRRAGGIWQRRAGRRRAGPAGGGGGQRRHAGGDHRGDRQALPQAAAGALHHGQLRRHPPGR